MGQSSEAARLNVTKLFWPPAPEDFVPRRHLQELLDEIGRRPLTLVSAPAGYGKTTTISAWLQSSRSYRAWLSLDESDNAPATFLTYFLAAIRKAIPGFADELAAVVTGANVPPNSHFIATLADELELLDRAVVLVLDDFQVIQNAEILALLTEWMRHPHPGLHLVLLTRHDPGLPLVAWRARNQMLDIRSNGLRFSPDESAEFLRRASKVELHKEDVARLQAQTEGWVVALRLVTLAMGRDGDRQQGAPEAGVVDHDLLEYMTGHVFRAVSPTTQQFLLETSMLERLSGSLCAALMPETLTPGDGQALLESLYRENMFLVPVDPDRQWFRYHHLFQEFLRRALESRYAREDVARLHQRAGLWYAENGYIEEAIRHYHAAGDLDAALSLVAEKRQDLMSEDRWQDLESWYRVFSSSTIESSPELLLTQAWNIQFRHFDLERISELASKVDELLAHPTVDPVRAQQLAGENAILKALSYYLSCRPEAALELCEQGLAVLPKSHYIARSRGWLIGATARQMLGDLSGAHDAIWEARHEDMSWPGQLRARAGATAGFVSWIAADLRGLRQAGESMVGAASPAQQPQSYQWGHYFLACASYHQNRLDDAITQAKMVFDRRFGHHVHGAVHSGMILAQSYLVRGELDKVDEIIDELVTFSMWVRSEPIVTLVESMRIELMLRRGQVAETIHWTDLAMERMLLGAMAFFYAPQLTVARALVARNDLRQSEKVADCLGKLQRHAEDTHNVRVLIEVLALQAMYQDSQGDHKAALTALDRSLHLAEPSGFVRLYVDLGSQMRGLLARVAQQDTSAEFVNRIRVEARGGIYVAERSSGALIESLTDREFQVLELLARRLSNKEIGDTLVITVSTVKRHTINIYQKLGVQSRRDAVEAALALGILD